MSKGSRPLWIDSAPSGVAFQGMRPYKRQDDDPTCTSITRDTRDSSDTNGHEGTKCHQVHQGLADIYPARLCRPAHEALWSPDVPLPMIKKMFKSRLIASWLGVLLASWINFIKATSRILVEPADYVDVHKADLPVLVAMWHGQHFVSPLALPSWFEAAVMISRSADGNVQARAVEQLGLATIRASGAQKAHQIAKRGGMVGFRQAVATLKAGTSVAMTCDVPKGPARVCGLGLVMLAATTGRPIVPVAVATSRRIVLRKTWDQAVINLPFSRAAVVFGAPIVVPPDKSPSSLEAYRARIEEAMNKATQRAYEIADQ